MQDDEISDFSSAVKKIAIGIRESDCGLLIDHFNLFIKFRCPGFPVIGPDLLTRKAKRLFRRIPRYAKMVGIPKRILYKCY